MRTQRTSASRTGHKHRLLIADDDPRLLELMTSNLADEAAEIICAEDGVAARDLLGETDFDLAIIDLGMPELDGFELITHLRQNPRTVDLPVIVVTGRGDKQAIEQAFAVGASTFVTKPLNWTLFRYQVQFVIRSGHIKKDLRLARDKADRANRAKDNLIQLLSHELRSPINVLVGFSEVLQRDLEGRLDSTQQAHLTEISQAGQRLSEVLSDVLFFSRLSNGDHRLQIDNTHLSELVEDAAVSLKGKARAKNIVLSYSDYTNGRELCAERNLVLDALKRLTDNAIKFSPDGTDVKLSTHILSDGSAVLAVHDTGPGITKLALEHCMQPFVQAEKALTRSEQGLGLGLPISKLIAEMHGGKLVVDAKPGGGTTASIWIPSSSVLIEPVQQAG